jgi:hypothetical protein
VLLHRKLVGFVAILLPFFTARKVGQTMRQIQLAIPLNTESVYYGMGLLAVLVEKEVRIHNRGKSSSSL